MSIPIKKPSTRKPLRQFSEVLNVKKTTVRRLGSAKSKHKYIRTVNMLWYSIIKSRGHGHKKPIHV